MPWRNCRIESLWLATLFRLSCRAQTNKPQCSFPGMESTKRKCRRVSYRSIRLYDTLPSNATVLLLQRLYIAPIMWYKLISSSSWARKEKIKSIAYLMCCRSNQRDVSWWGKQKERRLRGYFFDNNSFGKLLLASLSRRNCSLERINSIHEPIHYPLELTN